MNDPTIRWSNRVQPPPGHRAAALREAEERSYTLLEEYRIRAEHVVRACPTSPAIRALHRRLGLAGYNASHRIAPEVRQLCLATARERANAAIDDPDSLGALELRIEHALDAIADALEAAPAEDHLNIAQMHVFAARQTVRGAILAQRVGSLAGFG